MRKSPEKKYVKLALTIFLTGAALILFWQIAVNFSTFRAGLAKINHILAPFIYGLVMAYLMCPIYNFVVRKVYHFTAPHVKKKRNAFNFARTIGSIVALLVLIAAIGGFLALMVPQLVNSIIGIAKTLPEKFQQVENYVETLTGHIGNKEAADAVTNFFGSLKTKALNWSETKILPSLGNYADKISEGVIMTVKTLLNILIGMIICIYFLNGKERFKAQSKKFILALNKKEVSDEIFNFAYFTNRTFGGFINGKIIDSIIIGILCYISMRVLHLPYPELISTIVGVTNIIPFFGPFIGAIPSAMLVFLVDPIQALYFLIMILVLQQLDGNVIGPAILGGTTGLASFWVMFAIIVGGGLFGFLGMVLGVPVFAIIYYYVGRWINNKLKRKEYPSTTWDYQDFNKYDINRKDIM